MEPVEQPVPFALDGRTCACCGQVIAEPAERAFDAADPLAGARTDDGIFQRLPDPHEVTEEEARAPVFHPVALSKVLVLDLSTFGLYQVFWAYRNWRRLRDQTGQSLSPFWRSLFYGLWAFVLFREVREDAVSRGVSVWWRGGWMGLLYLALGVTWRLDGPAGLIALGAVIPVLIVQHAINEAAATAGVQPDTGYDNRHLPVIAIGPCLLALAIYGAFVE